MVHRSTNSLQISKYAWPAVTRSATVSKLNSAIATYLECCQHGRCYMRNSSRIHENLLHSTSNSSCNFRYIIVGLKITMGDIQFFQYRSAKSMTYITSQIQVKYYSLVTYTQIHLWITWTIIISYLISNTVHLYSLSRILLQNFIHL